MAGFIKYGFRKGRAMILRASFYQSLKDKNVHCYLCNHHCRIAEAELGFCGMRENRHGVLYTHAYGEVVAAHVDPIEKKPLFHVLPGSTAFSVATAGCNFHCGFCQNWQISQLTHATSSSAAATKMLPDEIVAKAKEAGCGSIAYTYTEPTIFFEYAAETAQLARAAGLLNVFVTNGYMSAEALAAAAPWLDACNVDLKSFNEDFYARLCQARLKPVLDSIRQMKELGIWVEITTLIIPGSNDTEEELTGIARFIASVDRAIPWHISRFHPDHQFSEAAPTPLAILEKARAIGICEGLRHVYVGNVAGEEDTICAHCNKAVIRRQGFIIKENALKGGRCPCCGKDVAGIFYSPDAGKKSVIKPARHVETQPHG
jgi:pyruvate formate lyase activating enzyme